ncbi:hypothetical protein Tco_0288895, partial [Tanacetum coccineum]
TAGNQTNRNAGIKDNVDAVPTNKLYVAGSGLDWLFDIDLLTNSTARNQTNRNAVDDDAGKKTNEEPVNEGERNSLEKE